MRSRIATKNLACQRLDPTRQGSASASRPTNPELKSPGADAGTNADTGRDASSSLHERVRANARAASLSLAVQVAPTDRDAARQCFAPRDCAGWASNNGRGQLRPLHEWRPGGRHWRLQARKVDELAACTSPCLLLACRPAVPFTGGCRQVRHRRACAPLRWRRRCTAWSARAASSRIGRSKSAA